nr:MAG TPA: hypothetical protein [Caudoviricetes sp.]
MNRDSVFLTCKIRTAMWLTGSVRCRTLAQI